MYEPSTGKLTRADVATWINYREPSHSVTVEALHAVVKLGVGGNYGAAYTSLASMALRLSSDPEALKRRAIEINEKKGIAYTQSSPDILKNFYTVGEICGLPPLSVWGVYVTKHVEAVRSWLAGLPTSEPIEESQADILVYAALGHFINAREGARC